jgi:hypothetical protein
MCVIGVICLLCLVSQKYSGDIHPCGCCSAFLVMFVECPFCGLVMVSRLWLSLACEYVTYCFAVFILFLWSNLVRRVWYL